MVDKATYELFKNRKVRAGLKALVDALADNEIAEINVSERDAQEPVFVLQPGHINAFSVGEPQEVLLLEKVRTMGFDSSGSDLPQRTGMVLQQRLAAHSGDDGR